MGKKLRVGIIGGGNMGAAILAGIRKKFSVQVAEKDAKRQHFLKKKFNLSATELSRLVSHSHVLILAVKPQDFETILGELKKYIRKDHLVISIAAGITTQFIEKRLGKGIRVIRTMPNLPAQIGMGTTGIARGKSAAAADLRVAQAIFQNIGSTLIVDESKLDAITAVSGSGPAYVFYFIEAFIAAAKKLGFSSAEATNLVFQTLNGSLCLAQCSSDDAATLRKKVTSKGGTTEAALKVFAQKKFEAMFAEALSAAKSRAKQLSR